MELLIAFGVGLAVGFVGGAVPDVIKHYSYAKNLERLSRPVDSLDPLEDEDDVHARERKEEAEYGFYS